MKRSSSGGTDDKGNLQKIGEGLGGLAGQAADNAAGVLGSLASSMGSLWAQAAGGRSPGSVRATFTAEHDRACREHFGAQAPAADAGYERARPLYQWGHVAGQNPDYQGRSFEEVEPELRRHWDDHARGHGEWPEVRGFVRYGYGEPSVPGGGARE